jgi:hypothetical protein
MLSVAGRIVYTMRRRSLFALLAIGALACNIDSVLEGPVPPDNRISVALDNGSVTLAQGANLSLAATTTRLADFTGAVDVAFEDVPTGIVIDVAPGTTTGKVTTTPLTLHASPDIKPGTYILTLRARGTANNVAATILSITVVEPPSFTLALSRSAMTLPLGGSLPVGIRLTRTNVTTPITLTAAGPGAVQASIPVDAVTGDTTTITIGASSSATPGIYDLKITASAAGAVDRSATVRVTVTSDAMVVSAEAAVSVAQAQSVTTQVFVNRASTGGAVTLRVDGSPAGLTATVAPRSTDPRVNDVTFTAGASVAAGTYTATLRASASGVPDATTNIDIVVTTAGIALSLSPTSLTLFPGTSGTVTAAITRTDFSGNVAVSTENVPAGFTTGVSQFSSASSSAAVSVTVGATVAAGNYTLTIRATPIGLSAAASRTATLDVIVRAAPSGNGNVILDWSRCTAPTWVAGQDGSGPWSTLTQASGVYRFNVVSGKGGFAYVEGDNAVSVRYMTQSELVATAIDMCSTQGKKTVTGTGAVHSITGTEQFFYSLGGGVGFSTPQNNNFTISGVRDGTHDLVVWGQSNFAGQRGYVRRDLDLPDGASLGTVTITGPALGDGFAGQLTPTTVTGSYVGGELYSWNMHYLTGAACDDNFLYSGGGSSIGQSSGTSSFQQQLYAVPADQQRTTDFHYETITLASPTATRSAGIVAHSIQGKTNTFAPVVAAPTVTSLAGSYKRLQITYGTDPSTRYNDGVALQYNDGRARSMNVSATLGYTGATGITLAMPDLRSAAGFPLDTALPSNSTGTYTAQLTGSSLPGSLCQEGKAVVSARHTGTF